MTNNKNYNVRLSIPSSFEYISKAREAVVEAAEMSGVFSETKLDDLRWLVSEAVTNAMEANIASNPAALVEVVAEVHPDRVDISVSDGGSGMPEVVMSPDISEAVSLEKEGSVGIPLMKHLASEFSFTSSDSGTTLELQLKAAS